LTFGEAPPPFLALEDNMALSVQEQMLVEQRVTNDSKSIVVAYLLWLFLGWISAHRFYLGRPGSAILQIITLLLVVGVIWWIIDLFLIPGMIEQDKDRLRREWAGRIASGQPA